MLYRSTATLIVAFWIVMTTLLIRNEVSPEASRLRELPLEHVLKVIYLHEQSNNLRIYSGHQPVGHLQINPATNKATGERLFEFTGSAQMQLTPGQMSHFSWDGMLKMSPTFELLTSQWGITLRDPGFVRVEVKTSADTPNAHFVLRSKDQILDERDVPMTEAGLHTVAQQFGATPDMTALFQQAKAQATQPTIRARQASLKIRGERTETYLVTVEQNGQMMLECHFSQLGQILSAKTILGHTLYPDDLAP